MIGDALLWLFVAARQLTCIHRYVDRRTPFGVLTWRECETCGREKDWNRNL